MPIMADSVIGVVGVCVRPFRAGADAVPLLALVDEEEGGGTSVVVDVVLEPLLEGRGDGAGISVVLGDARNRFAGEVVPSIDSSVTGCGGHSSGASHEHKGGIGKKEESVQVSRD